MVEISASASVQINGQRLFQPLPRDEGNLLLSYAQQRLLFLDQLESGVAYNIPLALEVAGKLDVAALQQSLCEIMKRHESLRTSFAVQQGDTKEGVPQQVIHPARPFDLPVVDLRSLPQATQTNEVKRLTQAEALRPFDLSQDLMLRAQLLQRAAEDFVLLLTMHHIALDDWSLGVLVRELATLYAGYTQGQPSSLPELPIQYADFAAWQRHYLQGEVLERQLTWWQAQLADAPDLLQLPSDRPRPAQQSFRGAAVAVQIEAGLTQQLRQLSRTQGCTLYMTLLAAFQVLLHRYTGQAQIVVGSPIANRNHHELEGLIGFFVNTMALCANLSGNPRFLDVLAQVQSTTQAAYDHQDLPFERLVEELSPERNLAYNPLVQVMFALQNAPMGDFTLPGLRVKPAAFEVKTTRLDIETHLWEVDDQLQGYCIYASDLFDRATIERMIGHFQALLKGIVAEPTQPIGNLPLLTKQERHQLLVEWASTSSATDSIQDTRPEPVEGKTIHQLFEEQVERTPDAVAVVMADDQRPETRDWRLAKNESPVSTLQSLTYAELNARANQLAHYLQSLGVGPEVLVGICVERSIEMIVGLLGILKAGGAYVPLDPAYPQDRLGFILADTQVPVLLTQQKVITHLPRHDAQVVDLVADWPQIAQQPSHNPPCQATPANLAYILYTSGSTGRPKGVAIEHHSPVALIAWSAQVFSNAELAGVLASTSICFDLSIFEIFLTLCRGGTVLLVENALELLYTPLAGQVTLINTVPSAMTELVRSNAIPASVQVVNLAGEPLKNALVQRIYQTPTVRKVYNLYGPSEDTTYSTFVLAPKGATTEPTIGRPIANTQAYIVDSHRQPAPIGVAGELLLGGAGLARGYLHRPELTNEKFIANPFGPGRLYRTGDLVRYTATGEIEFLGRLDHQIKIRGFRVELGEIESTLRQHPAVREAVVLAREDRPGDKHLVGYLVADQVDSALQTDHLQQWQERYEETYRQPTDATALALNLAGWRSSYTGEPIPAAEMAEWIAATIADIRQLHPKQILEIGCGTGLLLAQLAPDCDSYWGTDYSAQALAHVEQLKAAHQLNQVQLRQRLADDFSGLADGQFDCVILNSVAQYFPSVEYLLRVLEGAVRRLKPGGKLYVGDVRSYPLLSAYHASVQHYQASADLPLAELQTRIQQHMQDEEELLIDPAFFHTLPHTLPAICAVDVHLKAGRFHNELTRFRYQVVLHIGAAEAPLHTEAAVHVSETAWPQIGSLAALQTRLQETDNTALLVRNLPNARVQAEMLTRAAFENAATPPM